MTIPVTPAMASDPSHDHPRDGPRANALGDWLLLADFSPECDRVVEYAAMWAKRLAAAVHIAHFIRPLAYSLAGPAYGDLMERLWKEGQEGLAAIETGPALRGVRHDVYLDPGEVLDGLDALLRSRNIDLVVMASSGRRGIERILLGSTADAVFRSIARPTLILGPACRPESWAAPPRSLLFATDFGAAAGRALRIAGALAQAAQAEITVLHVLASKENENAGGAARADAAERLRSLTAGRAGAGAARVMVRTGRPDQEITRAAEELNAGLIVRGAKSAPKLSLYDGRATAYRVLVEAACPVLIVRE